jgi:hypothetical protein
MKKAVKKVSIRIITPQFERTPNMPDPTKPPRTKGEWAALRKNTPVELRAMGCAVWAAEKGSTLMLFPGEWCDSIPEGFELESISKRVFRFEKKKADRDIRFGCLAYGIRVKGEIE